MDRTAEIVNTYEGGSVPVRLVRGGEGFPGRNRNLGAAHAANKWLAFIDAGILPESNWLEALANAADTVPPPDVVYGSFAPIADTLFQECAAIAFVPPPQYINGELVRTRSIASVLLRRKVWEAVGGFPEDLRSAEDLLFMDRIEAGPFQIAHASRALVHWSLAPTFGKTLRRFVTYSHNNIRARLWRSWQARIVQRYALLLVLAAPAVVIGPSWLWIPLILWLLMLVMRSSVALRRNAVCFPAPPGRQFVRVIVISAVLAVIDLASIIGIFKWLIADRTFSVPPRSVDYGA